MMTRSDELMQRILALIPEHPKILELDDAWDLFSIPGFECSDLGPTMAQAFAALSAAKAAYANDVFAGQARSWMRRDEYQVMSIDQLKGEVDRLQRANAAMLAVVRTLHEFLGDGCDYGTQDLSEEYRLWLKTREIVEKSEVIPAQIGDEKLEISA